MHTSVDDINLAQSCNGGDCGPVIPGMPAAAAIAMVFDGSGGGAGMTP